MIYSGRIFTNGSCRSMFGKTGGIISGLYGIPRYNVPNQVLAAPRVGLSGASPMTKAVAVVACPARFRLWAEEAPRSDSACRATPSDLGRFLAEQQNARQGP